MRLLFPALFAYSVPEHEAQTLHCVCILCDITTNWQCLLTTVFNTQGIFLSPTTVFNRRNIPTFRKSFRITTLSLILNLKYSEVHSYLCFKHVSCKAWCEECLMDEIKMCNWWPIYQLQLRHRYNISQFMCVYLILKYWVRKKSNTQMISKLD